MINEFLPNDNDAAGVTIGQDSCPVPVVKKFGVEPIHLIRVGSHFNKAQK